jgi:hypothetical protein
MLLRKPIACNGLDRGRPAATRRSAQQGSAHPLRVSAFHLPARPASGLHSALLLTRRRDGSREKQEIRKGASHNAVLNFREGKYEDGRPISTQGAMPFKVQFVAAGDSAAFASQRTDPATTMPSVFNAGTMGVRPDTGIVLLYIGTSVPSGPPISPLVARAA